MRLVGLLFASFLVMNPTPGICKADESATGAQAPADTTVLRVGAGNFIFTGSPGSAKRPVTVHYYRPAAANADSPILFVMHGNTRNAETYRRAWISESEARGFILIVPEFSTEHYRQTRLYHQGNVLTASGAPVDSAQWTFVTVEAIFDEVRERVGSNRTTYHIYGHSAGSQFVHRMLWLMPGARIDNAVAANAGWYTLPTEAEKWPYGLGGTGTQADLTERLRAISARQVIILLGTADTSTTASDLATTPQAMAQGKHRFERGHFFYEHIKAAAAARQIPLEWKLQTVPGVAHSNGRMAPAAAAAIEW